MSTGPLSFFQNAHPSRPAVPSGAARRSKRRRCPQVANSVEHQAALAYRLTERDRWLIRMVFEHHVLHAGQISAVAFPSANAARERLRELHHWAVLDRFRPHTPDGASAQHYVLGPAGAHVLASEHGLDGKTLGYRRDRAMRIAHSIRLAHTVDRNGWFLALVARAIWAQDRPGRGLSAWWSEQRCTGLFGDLVRPDGYGRWHDPELGGLEFFLEYDRGTENTTQVARKLDGYARLAAQTGVITPVLVWLPTAARELHVRSRLAHAWRGLENPRQVPVATASAAELDPQEPTPSPADPVWLPIERSSAAEADGLRWGLSQLRQAWSQLATVTEKTPAWDRRGMLPAVSPMPPPPSHPSRHHGGGPRG